MKQPVKILCIGGSDSGGGAGIQADLKAVHACGCYGMSVITALTAQNSIGVQGIFPVTAAFVRKQLSSVLGDIGADAVKTGMIWKPGVVGVVAEKIKEYKIKKLVVDPVMVAKGGGVLMEDRTTKALVKNLLPLALVVTPNIPEAEILAQMKIKSAREMKKAAEVIYNLGVNNVLIKGGHLGESKKTGSVDILYNGKEYHELHADWIDTKNTHGTGCTFASVLAAGLGQGQDLLDAAQFAKIMITKAIKNSFSLGKGHGTINAGGALFSRQEKHECLFELQKAVNYLISFPCSKLIPEVSSNLVYAKECAENENQVAGFPGRIIRLLDKAYVVTQPEFGASRHMAHVVLAVMSFDPCCRSAMNIRYFEGIIDVCEKAGLKTISFSREEEPSVTKNQEGMSLSWGVRKVMQNLKNTPDIIYDTGALGKEAMVRVLGKNPMEVVKKVLLIHRNI